ncbi:MAG: HNH endonuclease [Chloracidobacterium sp.]|nr:HNH endonuclease [Chloracidobacterium sp.]
MALQPVEWVLVIYYGPEAHRATYGRQVKSNRYTKDYIQLSRKAEFLETISNIFPVAGGVGSVSLTYQWPKGTTAGSLVFLSADRPHLKWETSLGAPKAWKMSLTPSDASAETIPGDASHLDFDAAENELALLASRGAGQPYLLAIKLRDEPNKLHLRAYLENPTDEFRWADMGLVPEAIRILSAKTSQTSALKWSTFQSGGIALGTTVEDALLRLIESTDPKTVINGFDPETGRRLATYWRQPGYGLFFDPTRNHDAWFQSVPVSERSKVSADEILTLLNETFPPVPQGDAAAERSEPDPDEVEVFRDQIQRRDFEVPDSTATVKTRGSAQKAFADQVKTNYGFRCAITGIVTKDFLIAAHIVPWSKDQTIRLDPSNGICLSLIMDRAFEKGFLLIEDDYTIRIDWDKIGDDEGLLSQLAPYDGQKLNAPAKEVPKVSYLERRRKIVVSTE